ncbi:MAG: hydroxymethylbilane synthase [Deltaproteobacteria bacterium]|nr:hydroxymethylbilane synthase [Deltaproteobacteria bacterium]
MRDKSYVFCIATRKSTLAVEQSNLVARRIMQVIGYNAKLLEMNTTGDRKSDEVAPIKRDKKDWIRELEDSILEGRADLAIHSGKDVPVDIDKDTILIPVLRRESAFDVFIPHPRVRESARDVEGKFLECLPVGAVIGTSSIRRKSQLLRYRSDIEVVEHRGNVPTRLEKLKGSKCLHGIVLAEAGINRLGLSSEVVEQIAPEVMLPAINQGILVAQVRSGNTFVVDSIKTLIDAETLCEWEAERGCIGVLNADCNSAVGIYAKASEGSVRVVCRVLSRDGKICVERTLVGDRASAYLLGVQLGREILASGGRELLV